MKIIFLLSLSLLLNACAFSQNIGIGTETPQGKLHIKGTADTSQLIIEANATPSPNHPLVLFRTVGFELFRIHADNPSNLFIGYQAGLLTEAANSATHNVFIGNEAGLVNTAGYFNTVVGSQAFSGNSSGASNVAIGTKSLKSNTTGGQNTAIGYSSLASNTWATNNTAIGWSALSASTGVSNTAVGAAALKNNVAGYINTAVGVNALFNNSGATANNNTAIGVATLFNTTNAQFNTALGHYAGSQFNNGYNNVFLGANTDVNGAGYFNVIAIGQGTICTASSQVTIGNSATSSYRAYANWSNISDGRFKKNIQENVPGLDFITQLRPVTYNLNATALDDFLHPNTAEPVAANTRSSADASKAMHLKALKEKENEVITGFVAQDVEATAKQLGFHFSGVEAPQSAGDVYALRYADFVVPLVKGMQEQQAMIKKQDELIVSLQQQAAAMKSTISSLQKEMDELKALIKK